MLKSWVFYLTLIIALNPFTWAKATPLQDAKYTSLLDAKYTFDPIRVTAADNTFKFFRSFVDYYYHLRKQNPAPAGPLAQLQKTSGWCVGDAHGENFSFLIQNDLSTVFTMSDIDDSGPCPLADDLLRMLIGSSIYTSSFDLKVALSFYETGLVGGGKTLPAALLDLRDESLRKGDRLNEKKLDGSSFKRTSDMKEVSASEAAALKKLLANFNGLHLQDADFLDFISTAKLGGGSSGLLRYEVLLRLNGKLVHLELKEQTSPSIYPVAIGVIPDTKPRIERSLLLEQGPKVHGLYGTATFQNRDFFVRPKFAGNQGVSLSKRANSEDLDILYYELYILGKIHSRSTTDGANYLTALKAISPTQWQDHVSAYVNFFENKFAQLKP